eukprot:scaffold87023_cov45-Phaeocystis_antarctica.AAC.2
MDLVSKRMRAMRPSRRVFEALQTAETAAARRAGLAGARGWFGCRGIRGSGRRAVMVRVRTRSDHLGGQDTAPNGHDGGDGNR